MSATAATVRRLPYLLPLVIFAALAGYFWIGLGKDPRIVPSALIGQPVPPFELGPIPGRTEGLSGADLKGEVRLLNFFGSWCVVCVEEHPMLMRIAREGEVPVYGVDWRETSPENGAKWLARLGDPFARVGADPNSEAAIALGVTGAPETFVIDAHGVIRHKHVGAITPEAWEQTLRPLILRLRAEAGRR